ncbi:hypothetical protein KAJ27_02790 [bacterium]|nr:hypothetical protein [bacterium]
MEKLAKRIQNDGYTVINIEYPSRRQPIESLSNEIDSALLEADYKKFNRIHFITHGMGGILVRHFLKRQKPENLGRVVMLTPPNHGSEVADQLKKWWLFNKFKTPAGRQLGTDANSLPNQLGAVDFQLGVIAGIKSFNPLFSYWISEADDGNVSVSRSQIAGIQDLLVLKLSHNFMTNDIKLARQIVFFLKHGNFDHSLNVTEKIKNLGNPFHNPCYANNVWDIQVFRDKLYFGHGNSSNLEPEINSGPTSVISFNTKTAKFDTETILPEEQIDRFKIFNDTLAIPGHDPLDRPKNANFYLLKNGSWHHFDTLPEAYHVYDMIEHDHKLYAAVGPLEGQASILVSKDNGKTWTACSKTNGLRCYTLFKLGNTLYASYDRSLFQKLINDQFQPVNIWPDDVFPQSNSYAASPRIVRLEYLNEKMIYIGGRAVNDHQWHPFGLFYTKDLKQAHKVELPENHIPWDLIISDKTCFVLSSTPLPYNKNIFEIRVFASRDLINWKTLFTFQQPTFCRSFALSKEHFYFGMGTDVGKNIHPNSYTNSMMPESGQILQLNAADYLNTF